MKRILIGFVGLCCTVAASSVGAVTINRSVVFDVPITATSSPTFSSLQWLPFSRPYAEGAVTINTGDRLIVDFEIAGGLAFEIADLLPNGNNSDLLRFDVLANNAPGFTTVAGSITLDGFSGISGSPTFTNPGSNAFNFSALQVDLATAPGSQVRIWSGQVTFDFSRIDSGPINSSQISIIPIGERVTVVDRVAPIPLPAAAWMLIAGLGGLGLIAQRRRSS